AAYPPTGLHFAAQFPDKPTGRLSSSPQTRDHAFPDSTGLATGVSPERREYDEQLPSPPWPATDALHLSHFIAGGVLAAPCSKPEQFPVCRPIAGPAKTAGIDEGFGEVNRMAVELFPVIRQ